MGESQFKQLTTKERRNLKERRNVYIIQFPYRIESPLANDIARSVFHIILNDIMQEGREGVLLYDKPTDTIHVVRYGVTVVCADLKARDTVLDSQGLVNRNDHCLYCKATSRYVDPLYMRYVETVDETLCTEKSKFKTLGCSWALLPKFSLVRYTTVVNNYRVHHPKCTADELIEWFRGDAKLEEEEKEVLKSLFLILDTFDSERKCFFHYPVDEDKVDKYDSENYRKPTNITEGERIVDLSNCTYMPGNCRCCIDPFHLYGNVVTSNMNFISNCCNGDSEVKSLRKLLNSLLTKSFGNFLNDYDVYGIKEEDLHMASFYMNLYELGNYFNASIYL